MKTPNFFKEKNNELEKKLIEETKIKLEKFFDKNVHSENGGEGFWCNGNEVQILVIQTVENELRKNGWKGQFYCKEDSESVKLDGDDMVIDAHIISAMWLKISQLTKLESILIR